LDVPEEAFEIAFGVLLSGSGTVWSDNFAFDVVDVTFPVPGGNFLEQLPKQPVNLDFEER
jgi:hypothetical protein